MIHAGTTEQTESFTLRWSLDVDAEGTRARLRYELTALEELYLSDRLWDLDRAGARVGDPFEVYRFVCGDALRLVFAQSPAPPGVSLRQVYKPLCSRVRAGEIHRREIALTAPIDEYSALARDVGAPHERSLVSRVSLVFDYRRRADLSSDPSPPPGESEAVGFIVHDLRRYVSTVAFRELPVHRRTGPIARLALPGDP